MPLLIDAYNVLHVVGVLPPELAGPDVPALARLIVGSRWSREPVLIVCDGTRPSEPESDRPLPSGVRLRYSGAGRSADDLIRAEIARSSAPRRLLVVSSDHEIERAARRRRCETMRSEDFLARLVQDHDRTPRAAPPSPAGPLDLPEDLRREAAALEAAWSAAPPAPAIHEAPAPTLGEDKPVAEPTPDVPDDVPDAPSLPILLPPEMLAEALRLLSTAPPPPPPSPPAAPSAPAVPLEPVRPEIPIANGVAAMVREAMALARELGAPRSADAGPFGSPPESDDRGAAFADADEDAAPPSRRDGPWIPDEVLREAARLLQPEHEPEADDEPRRPPC